VRKLGPGINSSFRSYFFAPVQVKHEKAKGKGDCRRWKEWMERENEWVRMEERGEQRWMNETGQEK